MLNSQSIAGKSHEQFVQQDQPSLESEKDNEQQEQQQLSLPFTSNVDIQSPFSPLIADTSMAILSPPSSRYAFDPNNSSSSNNNSSNKTVDPLTGAGATSANNNNNNGSFNQFDTILSPLLATVTSPVSDLNFANLNLNIVSSPPPGYGIEHDVPAFQPQTGLQLENFTNDLKLFNNWFRNLSVEEQKTSIGLIVDSIESPEVTEFVKYRVLSKLSNHGPIHNPLATSIPNHLRPVSPIIPISQLPNNGMHSSNIKPITLDSILNDDDNDNESSNIFNPEPRKVNIRNGFPNIIEPVERPKSAGPIYAPNTFNKNGLNGNGNVLLSPLLSTQPLARVLSNDNFDINNGSSYYNNEVSLDAKLQHSLNTINSRSILDYNKNFNNNGNNNSGNNNSSSNVTPKEDRGRQKYLQNRHLMNNMNMSNMNNMNNMGLNNYGMNYSNNMNSIAGNLNMSGFTGGNYGNIHGNTSNSNTNNYYGHNNYNHVKSTAQSSSVPPNNRIRANKNTPNKKTGSEHGVLSPLNGEFKNAAANTLSTAANNAKASANGASNTSSNSNLPKDISSDALLSDVPAWLKVLRLHKYTDKLQHLKWQELINLDDEALEKLGVSTVGARNKLIKSFNYVKEQRGL